MRFQLNTEEYNRLLQAMENYQGDAEKAINEVLHEEASQLMQEAIRKLIPTSNRKWKGKRPPARAGKSLTDQKENLAITVKTTKQYQYLYFPDDGSSTKKHAGNQQFFLRGGESQREEIINRCINRLVNNFGA